MRTIDIYINAIKQNIIYYIYIMRETNSASDRRRLQRRVRENKVYGIIKVDEKYVKLFIESIHNNIICYCSICITYSCYSSRLLKSVCRSQRNESALADAVIYDF